MASPVLFDLYGTLVDLRLNEDTPAVWNGVAAAIRDLGGDTTRTPEVRDRFLGMLTEEGARREHGFVMEAVFRRLLESYGASADVAALGSAFRRLSTDELSLRAYVRPLFEALRRKQYAIGIVSNTEAVLTRCDLERCPILLSADTIVLSSDVGVRKPDSRIFGIALNRLHATPSASVFIGNSLAEDIEGARRAGLRAIYLDDAAAGVEPLTADGTSLCVAPTGAAIAMALEAFGYPL
jgi:putative hydrolase of the HAD superfamily